MSPQDAERHALDTIRREDFLPPRQRRFAHQDRALEIGYRQTSSQPSTVLHLLKFLEVEAGHRVLDVGSGSGWTSALLGELVGDRGRVYGVELVPDLVTWSRKNLAAYPMPWVTISSAHPDLLGLPEHAPYDRILVSAEATRIPSSLVEQLRTDGLLVVPVLNRMTSVRRTVPEPTVVRHGYYSFVPLIEPAPAR